MYRVGKKEVAAVREVLKRGQLDRYVAGENGATRRFERAFSARMNSSHTLAVSSGTAALICGLVGMEIGPGDEVIIPAVTYIATALAVLGVGAIPVIAEVDSSLTINPADIERKITTRTKAIVPVHMYGLPANMAEIMKIAKEHHLQVLEDAAQACGGQYSGRSLGTIGHAGAFSFNHFKILTCGEGGALISSDKRIYRRAVLQQHGGAFIDLSADHFEFSIFAGGNYRLSEILSGILLVQLSRLDSILSSLRREKRYLQTHLAREVHDLKFNPVHDVDGECATHLFILFEEIEQADRFVKLTAEKNLLAWKPGRYGHVYTSWKPILNQVGAHHRGKDPYRLVKVPVEYSLEMCPQSLAILDRTVTLPIRGDRNRWKRKQLLKQLVAITRQVL